MNKLKLAYILLILLGIIIHFTIKDSYFWSSLIFYSLPLPVLIILTVILAVILKNKPQKAALYLSIIFCIIWYNKSYVLNKNDLEKTGLEIVFWNASHNNGFEDLFNEIKNIPDISVLVECDMESFKKVKLKYTNYYFHLSKEGIGLFSKMPIKIIQENTSENNSTVLKFETNDITFYAVDISASVFNFRKEAIEFVSSNIDNWHKTIVLGDFNTPFESIYFEAFSDKFNHSFSDRGNGFKETWFWNLPILSLDHIWVSKDIEAIKVEKINTFESDHIILKTTIVK